jgi:hypothetical protein
MPSSPAASAVGPEIAVRLGRAFNVSPQFWPPAQFIDPLKEFCRRLGIKTKTAGDRFYLLDVRLVLLCHKLRRERPFVFAPQQGQRDRMATSFAMSRRRKVEIELGT